MAADTTLELLFPSQRALSQWYGEDAFLQTFTSPCQQSILTSVDSDSVENCYLVLLRLIMRLNSYISRSDYVVISFGPSVDL